MKVLGYLWRLGLVALIGLAVYWYLFRSHLASKEFATRLSGPAAAALGAQSVQFDPLSWQGGQATLRRLSANGGDGAFFRKLEATDVSFHVPLGMFWQPHWRLSRLEAGSLQVEFRSGGMRATGPDEDEAGPEPAPGTFSPPVLTAPGQDIRLDAAAPDPELNPEAKGRDARVLDLKLHRDGLTVEPPVRSLEVAAVEAARFGASWGISDATRGGIHDASLWAARGGDGSWAIEVPAGTLTQNWLRDVKFTGLRARLAQGVLSLESTPVQLGEVAATLSGTVRCAEVPVFDLALQGENLPLESFCGDPFDRFMKLEATGTLKIGGSTNRASGITVDAALQATGGFLRGLAIQQALAGATTRIRFREFEITGGTIEFATSGGRLHVKSFSLASRGDAALRGSFTYEKGVFAGELQIGADPVLLQKLAPAVQDRFFAKSEGGKRWLVAPLEGEFDRLTSGLAREFTAAHEAAAKP